MNTQRRNQELETARQAKTDMKYLQKKRQESEERIEKREEERKAIADGLTTIFQEFNPSQYTDSFWVPIRTKELRKLMRKHRHYKPILYGFDFRVQKVKFSFGGVKVLFTRITKER